MGEIDRKNLMESGPTGTDGSQKPNDAAAIPCAKAGSNPGVDVCPVPQPKGYCEHCFNRFGERINLCDKGKHSRGVQGTLSEEQQRQLVGPNSEFARLIDATVHAYADDKATPAQYADARIALEDAILAAAHGVKGTSNPLIPNPLTGSTLVTEPPAAGVQAHVKESLTAGVTVTAPLNGIPATDFHGEGAIARCSYCRRYSLDRKTLGEDRYQPMCECGQKHGWSGSFKKPGPDAKWSGSAPGVEAPGEFYLVPKPIGIAAALATRGVKTVDGEQR